MVEPRLHEFRDAVEVALRIRTANDLLPDLLRRHQFACLLEVRGPWQLVLELSLQAGDGPVLVCGTQRLLFCPRPADRELAHARLVASALAFECPHAFGGGRGADETVADATGQRRR